MDLQTIEGHVSRYILDSVASTDAEIDTFINRAIRVAEERYNFPHMQKTEPYVTTEGQRLLGVRPATWKEHRGLPYLTSDDYGDRTEIQWAPSESEMNRLYVDEGAPATDRGEPLFLLQFYNEDASAGDESEFHAYPTPDGGSDYSDGDYRVYVPHWGYSAALADPTDTNWFTENLEWYVIYRATAEGLLSNREERRAGEFLQLAEADYRRVTKQLKRAKLQRPDLSTRTDVYGPSRIGRRIRNGGLG